MTTLLQYHTAVMNGPDAKRATAMLRQMCSGTTSEPEKQRVIWMCDHLALVSRDFGSKSIVIVDSVRDPSPAQCAARRRLFPFAPDDRLSPSAIREWINKLSRADAVWAAVVAEEQAKIDAANAASQAKLDAHLAMLDARGGLLRVALGYIVGGNHSGVWDGQDVETAREWLAEIEKRTAKKEG